MCGSVVVRTMICRVRRRHPAMAVYVVVVATHITRTVYHACIRMVRRDIPREMRCPYRRAETQVLCSIVHAAGAIQPHTLQVQWHVYLVACVSIVAENPQLVIGRVDPFCPDLIHEYVSLYLVFVAAVNHNFVLPIQVVYRAFRLASGEVMHRRGCCR